MEHAQATRVSSSLDRLASTFAEINSYGVEVRVLREGDPADARQRLRRELLDQYPQSAGSFVFWLATERECFSDEGALVQPLMLHCSAEESARVARQCLAGGGFVTFDREGPTLEVADPIA